ncbi:MAG: tetratricopeptide repeat protein [Verrucomicrobiales bacterium]|nr:tetratricopeptide repeat protein [Verrucomicrobiales bacterium]
MSCVRLVLIALMLPLLAGCHQVHEARARQLTQSALEAFFEQDHDKALEHAEIALRLGSKEPTLYWMLSSIHFLRGDAPKALEEIDLAIAGVAVLTPEQAAAAESVEFSASEQKAEFLARRANVLEALGRSAEALASLREAIAADPENAGSLNNLAWLLATCPDDALRDGKEAIGLARKACELTDWEEAGHIDTLAAAYAEAGDYEQAVKWQREAMAKATPEDEEAEVEDGSGFEDRLKDYEAGRPHREDNAEIYRKRHASGDGKAEAAGKAEADGK